MDDYDEEKRDSSYFNFGFGVEIFIICIFLTNVFIVRRTARMKKLLKLFNLLQELVQDPAKKSTLIRSKYVSGLKYLKLPVFVLRTTKKTHEDGL